MIESANRSKAELASVVVGAEGGHRSFPGLRPLPPTNSGGKIASALVVPASSDVASQSSAAIAFDERADGTGARDEDGPVVANSLVGDIWVGTKPGKSLQASAHL